MLPAGTTNGYRVYTTDPFNKQSESREGDVSSLEMLFSTSLVALTLSPRVLRIQNTKVHAPHTWFCCSFSDLCTEALDHLRDDFSYRDPGNETEQKTTGSSTRVRALHLRH